MAVKNFYENTNTLFFVLVIVTALFNTLVAGCLAMGAAAFYYATKAQSPGKVVIAVALQAMIVMFLVVFIKFTFREIPDRSLGEATLTRIEINTRALREVPVKYQRYNPPPSPGLSNYPEEHWRQGYMDAVEFLKRSARQVTSEAYEEAILGKNDYYISGYHAAIVKGLYE